MQKMRSLLAVVILALLPLLSVAEANTLPQPYALVDKVTTDLMLVVRQKSDPAVTPPAEFHHDIGQLLDPVVDFRFIAMAVMGSYAKQASPEQREAFVAAFRDGMISTYSKGLSGFTELQLTIIPPQESIDGKRRLSVLQEVTGGEKIHRVYYTMAQNRAGDWKLINLVLNGVNLGETLRNQFASAMRREGDLDKVIAHWGDQPAATEAKQG